jgi:glutaredoxin 3
MSSKSQAANQLIESAVADHQIVIFSKSWCPRCVRTKALLESPEFHKVDVKIFDLDLMENGPAVQCVLLEKTGQKSVPNVWVTGAFLGGNDKTQAAYRSGQLWESLQIPTKA